MADIILADDGIVFDGRSIELGPLGGAESSFIELANALAARGHRVRVWNRCAARLTHQGVDWMPLSGALPEQADLYIANRDTRLLRHVPKAQRRAFWIHNPARYLLKPRHQFRLAHYRPIIIFLGEDHARGYPRWASSGGRRIIPYGLTALFRGATERSPPPPRAVFTSNPLRSLDWVLDSWEQRIHPEIPNAEFHIFAGAATYGAAGSAKAGAMAPVLERAQALSSAGVVLRGPVAKAQLAEELQQARVLLYRGDIGETFCLAVGEAQAMGVPAVLEDIACMRERVRHAETGYVVRGADAFADAALSLLRDDELWISQHRACLAKQRHISWQDSAQLFETLLAP